MNAGELELEAIRGYNCRGIRITGGRERGGDAEIPGQGARGDTGGERGSGEEKIDQAPLGNIYSAPLSRRDSRHASLFLEKFAFSSAAGFGAMETGLEDFEREPSLSDCYANIGDD